MLGATNITDLPPAKRGTAMMFQSYALFPHLDCIDNVAFSLKMRGVDKAKRRRQRASELLDARRHGALRRAPAGAAVRRPAAARRAGARADHRAADRCCSTSRCRRSTRSCASRCAWSCSALQRKLGIIFVHVTHSQDEAMALADLDRGHERRPDRAGRRRRATSSTRPRTEFVARFIGGHNVITSDGRPDRGARRPAGPAASAAQAGTRRLHRRHRPLGRIPGHLRPARRSRRSRWREISADARTRPTFDADPVQPGDPVAVSWGERRHPPPRQAA